jgi:hypothetical protein
MTTNSVPMFDSTVVFDLDKDEQIALVAGVCPMPNGSLVRVTAEGEARAREYRVVRTRLQIGNDATLVIDCRLEPSAK